MGQNKVFTEAARLSYTIMNQCKDENTMGKEVIFITATKGGLTIVQIYYDTSAFNFYINVLFNKYLLSYTHHKVLFL